MPVTSHNDPRRPANRLLELLQDASDRTLITNALRHHADALRHASDHVGVGSSNVRKAALRADAIATELERSY